MRVCITLQQASQSTGVEECIFRFIRRLESCCDSITACHVTAAGPADDWEGPMTWCVRVAITVFGDEIEVGGLQCAPSSKQALEAALLEITTKLGRLLRALAHERSGCSCGDHHKSLGNELAA